MVERNPLVLIDGQIQTLPGGDTISGASGGGGGSGDGYSSESVIITMVAGESLAQGCAVMVLSDSEDDDNPKAYNFVSSLVMPIGIANQTVSVGQSVDIIVHGKAFIPDSAWALNLIPDEPNPDIELTFPTKSYAGVYAYVDNTSSTGELTVEYPSEDAENIYSIGIILSGGTGNSYILVRPLIVFTPLDLGGGGEGGF
jgi:hypothetical protein